VTFLPIFWLKSSAISEKGLYLRRIKSLKLVRGRLEAFSKVEKLPDNCYDLLVPWYMLFWRKYLNSYFGSLPIVSGYFP
jgi:hypothetical protein